MRMILMILVLLPGLALADDRLVRLYAPEPIIESGLLKFILPRFSLKTQVRVEIVGDEGSADLSIGGEGRAVFNGLGKTWHLSVARPDHAGTKRLTDWLGSDVGRRTVFGYAPEGSPLFTEPVAREAVVADVSFDGDAAQGQALSLAKCGRCHVTERGRGIGGIGSTPSFSVLRSLEDWELRFSAFYTLRPHPAFTQVAEVTEPFPEDRPSPIAPIEITLDDLEAILAYVAALKAADLGAPIKHQ